MGGSSGVDGRYTLGQVGLGLVGGRFGIDGRQKVAAGLKAGR